jgi:hypothetical protein
VRPAVRRRFTGILRITKRTHARVPASAGNWLRSANLVYLWKEGDIRLDRSYIYSL